MKKQYKSFITIIISLSIVFTSSASSYAQTIVTPEEVCNAFVDDNTSVETNEKSEGFFNANIISGGTHNTLHTPIDGNNHSIVYTFSDFISDFTINTFLTTSRLDKAEFFTIEVSTDGTSYIELTESDHYNQLDGERLSGQHDWINSYDYVMIKDSIAPIYKYLRITMPKTTSSGSVMLGTVSVNYSSNLAYIGFNGLSNGNKNVKIVSNKAFNLSTINRDSFTLADGTKPDSIAMSDNNKEVILTFANSFNSFTTHRINVSDTVKDEDDYPLHNRSITFSNDYSITGTENNEIKNVAFGAGGRFTGIVFHPSEKGLVYARNDVGGIFRFDDEKNEWIPLLDGFGPENEGYQGVAGIAIDPNNADIVYAAVGSYWYVYDGRGCVLKSYDRGATWEKTGLTAQFTGSSTGRDVGERIMVDPKNSNVIYCGTSFNGLHVSRDAGSTWTKVNNISSTNTPATTSNMGVCVIEIDETSPVVNGRTSVVYAVNDEVGIYKSSDGGSTWNLINGSPTRVYRMESFNGDLYIASADGAYIYDGTTFTNISPNVANLCSKSDGGHQYHNHAKHCYSAIAVTENKAGERVIFLSDRVPVSGISYPCHIFVKVGDNDWILRNSALTTSYLDTHKYMQWLTNSNGTPTIHQFAVNPFPENEDKIELWYPDGYGIWTNRDILNPYTKFEGNAKGTDITCVNYVHSSNSGRLFVGIMDYYGFMTDNVDDYGIMHHTAASARYVAGDTSVKYPQYLAVAHDGATYGGVLLSEDSGNSFKNALSYTSGSMISMADVAISADLNPSTNKPTILVEEKRIRQNSYTTDTYIKYSDDFGETWNISQGLPANIYTGTDTNLSINNIEGDKVNANQFYVYDHNTGEFYYSTDYGHNFTKSESLLPKTTQKENTTVVAHPRRAGEVYIGAVDSGLYKSVNGLVTVEKLVGVDEIEGFSFGAPTGEGDICQMYLLGKINGQRALYRSDDDGSTWVKMNDERNAFAKAICIEGDKTRKNTVYIGTSGRGTFICRPCIDNSASGITSLKITKDGIKAEWNMSGNGFKVFVNGQQIAETNEQNYIFTSATEGETYYFKIVALDGSETSEKAIIYTKGMPYKMIFNHNGMQNPFNLIGTNAQTSINMIKNDTLKTSLDIGGLQGLSAHWEIPKNNKTQYSFVRFGPEQKYPAKTIDLTPIKDSGYLKFKIYADAATTNDLPSIYLTSYTGKDEGGTATFSSGNKISLKDKIVLNKWNEIRIPVYSTFSGGLFKYGQKNNGVDLWTCVANVILEFPQTRTSDYDIYISELGFYEDNFAVSAETNNGSSVTLSWTGDAAQYNIYKDGELVERVEDRYSFIDTKLKPNTEHEYIVEAVDGYGNYLWDDVVTARGPELVTYYTVVSDTIINSDIDQFMAASILTNGGSGSQGSKTFADHGGNIGSALKLAWRHNTSKNEITSKAQYIYTSFKSGKKLPIANIWEDGYLKFDIYIPSTTEKPSPTIPGIRLHINNANTTKPMLISSQVTSYNEWHTVLLKLSDFEMAAGTIVGQNVNQLRFQWGNGNGDINFTDVYVKNMAFVIPETSLTATEGEDGNVTVTIDNVPTGDNVKFIVAQYGEGESLVFAEVKELTEATVITPVEDATRIKAFLWDDMKPLTDAAEVTLTP